MSTIVTLGNGQCVKITEVSIVVQKGSKRVVSRKKAASLQDVLKMQILASQPTQAIKPETADSNSL